MSTKNRFVVAAIALFTVGAVVLAAYAADDQQTNPNQNQNQASPNQANPNQPNTTPPNTFQQGGTQPGAIQPGQPGATQPGTNQPVPYQANRIPGQTEVGQLNQQGRQDVDLFLIPCLIDANNAEVTLGNLASQRGQSSEVKNFAQEMVKDHTDLLNQTKQLQTTMTQQVRPQNPNNTPVAAELFLIKSEIDKACLASDQRMLQEAQDDFDRVYIACKSACTSMCWTR